MADLLTTGQVQDLLHVDRTTIYRMVEDGRLPAVRVGKQWRFSKGELERWLQAQAAPANAGAAPRPASPATPGAVAAGTPPLSEVLPLECVQLIQDTFAGMLGVMMIITDMEGRPVTQVSNPCAFFIAATRNAGGVAACTVTWQQLAGSIALEPRFMPSEVGLLCARGLIRLRSELKGLVMIGGIAPDAWPPEKEQLAAIAAGLGTTAAALQPHVDEVYYLDGASRERALRFVQRIADVFSHIAEDRNDVIGRLRAIAALTAL